MARSVIAAVVEGQGEVSALPKLLHKIAHTVGCYDLHTPSPHRVPRSQLAKRATLEAAVHQQSKHLRGANAGGVLVLLDADDDCPAQLGPQLLAWAEAVRPDIRVRVVVASREYESWFLAGAASLAGLGGFPEDLEPPKDPDHHPRDAKKWLEVQRGKRPYKETVDQLTFSSHLDVELTRSRSDSFDKLCRDVTWLLRPETR